MIEARPGLDVSELVKAVLSEPTYKIQSRFSYGLRSMLRLDLRTGVPEVADPYERLFTTAAGKTVADRIGNESKTLDLLSTWSIEILFEYVSTKWGFDFQAGALAKRFLGVPGSPENPPALLVLDPAVDVSQSRRLTDEIDIEPAGLIEAFIRLRPFLIKGLDDRLLEIVDSMGMEALAELLWVSQPEVILSRRPKMVPLSAPTPHLAIRSGGRVSTAGIVCKDDVGDLGVTACFHGTGPVGTPVIVAGLAGMVKHADPVQDIVFIPMPSGWAKPSVYGLAGVRSTRAPSEAEPVVFEGAGSGAKVSTRVKSHDAGILRMRRTVQLKVQTPADTNTGDSGSALVDGDDHIIGFGFERTAPGDFPELTDWIWAANALDSLGLTPA
jgi:hypothetical protein